MAKFVYKMENVLKIKERIEDQKKTEFALAQNKLKEEEEKMSLLLQRYKDYQEEEKKARLDKIDIVKIRHLEDGIKACLELIKAEAVQVKVAKKNLEVCQKRLADAVMERKIQEKLKEKAFSDFKREINLEEMKEIDEVISFNYNNRNI